jgi:hypothetical protein
MNVLALNASLAQWQSTRVLGRLWVRVPRVAPVFQSGEVLYFPIMKRIRAWLTRILGLDKLQASVQQRLLDLDNQNRQLRAENDALAQYARGEDEKTLVLERQSEYAEALSMYGAGPWRPTGVTVNEAGKVDAPAGSTAVALKERYWELELALEDRGWQRQLAMAQTEFSRYGIQQIILICRLYFIKNPLVRRGVELCADYVFGRSFQITSEDEAANSILESFLTANAKQLGVSALLQKERTLKTDGNLFWAFFTDAATGEVMVQTIDAVEIEDVVTDPDNSDVLWFVKRRYMQAVFNPDSGQTEQTAKVCWYVALGYETTAKSFGPSREPVVRQKNGEPVYVYQRKVGALEKWRFGCPEVYPMIDWVRAYKHYLEDWCTLQRAFARFSWDIETKGAPALSPISSKRWQRHWRTAGHGGSRIRRPWSDPRSSLDLARSWLRSAHRRTTRRPAGASR